MRLASCIEHLICSQAITARNISGLCQAVLTVLRSNAYPAPLIPSAL